ncbi:MAG: sensor histidine kinase [Polyangiales bacterium]
MGRVSRARVMWAVARLALLTALVFVRGARAQHVEQALSLDTLAEDEDLASRASLLRDESGALTLSDVRRRFDAFLPHDGSPLSFGLDYTALWLRVPVRNESALPRTWLLEVPEPTLEHVQLHVVHRDGRSESYQSGTALPFSSRGVRHANFVFELTSPAHDEAMVYVRARSDYVLRAPLHAWTPAAYAAHHENDLLVRALCIGALLLVALYHFGVFILVRQLENLWYSWVALALGGVMMSLTGQLGQFVLPNHPHLVARSLSVTIAFAMVMVAFFTHAATEPLKTLPALTRLLFQVALSTLGLLALALLAPVGLVLRLELAILMLLCTAGPYILYAARTFQIPEMRLYTMAWYALILTIPVAILRYAGVWPDGLVGEWILPIGFVGYGVANSLALASLASRLRTELGTMNVRLVNNVEELQQALVRAEEANESARRATKAKDEFVATMSHELRTPLNAIINIPQGLIGEFATQRSAKCSHCQAAYLLDDEDTIDASTVCESCGALGKLVEGTKVKYHGDEARCLRFLQKIERSGQHLLQMVNGVLDYSKMEAGRFELVLGPVDLDALIREVSDQMVDIAQRKNITIEVATGPAREGPLMADVLRLKQVLINLLANAIKFSEGGTAVRLRWTSTSEAELIEVEDRGIGIAPADHERVFTSFEQVHKGDTRKYGGTGLGLSISRSLVRMHGGELSVRSELGQGATFLVWLPRMPASSDSKQNADLRATPENSNADVVVLPANLPSPLEQTS